MTYVRLKAIICENSGELGLCLDGMKMGYIDAATSGELVAHDIIEHQNGAKSIGGICDELEALGGVWFARGQHGYLRPGSRHAPQEDLASDVMNLLSYVNNGCRLERKYSYTHRHDYDEEFEYIIELARKDARDCDEPFSEEYGKIVLHALRTGFRKASRRFESGFAANRMFWHISEAVNSLIKYEMEWEGQEFLLGYTQNEASARPIEDEYYG